jgi:type IV pilus assembly protein PilW
MRGKPQKLQHGFTLIECMIALTLGMLVIAAATALLLSAQQTYLAIDDSARIDDAGASALAALGAAIRQAAYVDHGGPAAAPKPPSNAVFGIDNARPAENDPFDLGLLTRPAAINGSDMLVTRFMATDIFGKPDPDMRNCAGDILKKPATPVDRETVYNWSIFYIARGASGETELFCKPFGKNGPFRAEAVVRGVEAMQLLYGMDRNGDGLPDTFLQAAAIDAADWAKVTAVSIALSVRGASLSRSTPRRDDTSQSGKTDIRHLFGLAYSAQHADGDPGVSLDIARMKPCERNRSRRIVRGIVMLRNKQNAGEG